VIKVYVAGSSKEIERAERVIAALRARGVEVSHDWTATIRRLGGSYTPDDAALLPELRADIEDGVFGAAFVLVLAPSTPSIGMWVELGAAWAVSLPIVTAGSLAMHPWLRALAPQPYLQHETDDAAIACVVQLAREAA
jgi:hypothetical protein